MNSVADLMDVFRIIGDIILSLGSIPATVLSALLS